MKQHYIDGELRTCHCFSSDQIKVSKATRKAVGLPHSTGYIKRSFCATAVLAEKEKKAYSEELLSLAQS